MNEDKIRQKLMAAAPQEKPHKAPGWLSGRLRRHDQGEPMGLQEKINRIALATQESGPGADRWTRVGAFTDAAEPSYKESLAAETLKTLREKYHPGSQLPDWVEKGEAPQKTAPAPQNLQPAAPEADETPSRRSRLSRFRPQVAQATAAEAARAKPASQSLSDVVPAEESATAPQPRRSFFRRRRR